MAPLPGSARALAAIAIAAAVLSGCTCLNPTTGPVQNGVVCANGAACASGFCVDGVCCDEACDGGCRSCNLGSQAGSCVPFLDGTDPGRECGGGPCGGACNGQGACRYPAGEKSCGDRLCVGATVQTAVCDGKGQCAQKVTPCAPYACQSGACLTQCSVPLECAGAATCKPGGTCVDKLPLGSPCGAASACASGSCADNVCCDLPCGGRCESCGLPDAGGTCTAHAAGTDPDTECPKTGVCGASCNGARACAYADAGTPCGAGSCTLADSPLVTRVCNGAGACIDSQSSCAPFACLAGACSTTCTTDVQCRTNAYCDNGACLPRKVLGASCVRPEECDSRLCVDDVCCSSACNGPCDTCTGTVVGLCTPIGSGGTPTSACSAGQACGAGALCPTTCGVNAPCLPSHYCDGFGACQPKKVIGALCAGDAECSSGLCIDGVCCESNCRNQPCRGCGLPGASGQCLPLAWGAAGGCPDAGLYACRADGVCASGPCADDRDCKQGAFCAGLSGCLPKLAAGGSCSRDRECASALCVDGVCCTSGCDGGCQACNLAGSRGTCTPIPARQDPSLECAGSLACTGGSACFSSCATFLACEQGNVCLADAGACIPGNPLGTACVGPEECASNLCVDGVCCNSACAGPCRSCKLAATVGTCTSIAASSDPEAECSGGLTCGALADGGAFCRTSCSGSAQCEPGYGCISNSCVLLKPVGDSCTAPGQCQSNNCVDFVCCASLCEGTCQACNFAGNLGACLPMAAGTDPAAECGQATCNGLGGCGTSCSIDSQCAPAAFCNVPACAPKRGPGQACSAHNWCISGNCYDNVCCDFPCGAPCQSCNQVGKVGVCTNFGSGVDPEGECSGGLACTGDGGCNATCATPGECEAPYHCDGGSCVPDKGPGEPCGAVEECTSAFCKDGVCCNAACDGGCQSCAIPSQEGTCTPYTQGTDPEAECGLAWCSGSPACFLPCSADGQCKGGNFCDKALNPDACAAKKLASQPCDGGNQCLSDNCVDSVCCDLPCGAACMACNVATHVGACWAVPNQTDPPDDCGLTFCNGSGACISPCSAQADCESNAYCGGGTCSLKKANGIGCGFNFECINNQCVDGYCCNSACIGSCNACDLPGYLGSCRWRVLGDPGTPACEPYECRGDGGTCPGSCSTDSQCAGAYHCEAPNCVANLPNGSTCNRAAMCTSGQCVDNVCCGSASCGDCQTCAGGSCTSAAAGTDPKNLCGFYWCSGSANCPNSCGNDADCKSPKTCISGAPPRSCG